MAGIRAQVKEILFFTLVFRQFSVFFSFFLLFSTKEMTWVTSDECVNTKRCKRSLDKKKFKLDKIQAKLDKKLGKFGHNCNIVPKCWPVMKWVTNPVWKSVCSETWSEECRDVREPRCEVIRDSKCERMPMPMNMNVTKRVCIDESAPGNFLSFCSSRYLNRGGPLPPGF